MDLAAIGLTIESKGLRAGVDNLRRLEREGGRTERQMGRVSSAAKLMGGALAAAAGGASFARIIKETAAFEDAMLGLKAVSGATATQMAQLEQQARSLGATSMFSAQQAGEAQRFLAQAGFEVNEVLSATPGILNLATAANLELGRAADIASNVLGGMQLEVSELARVNDVLAKTAASSNTTIEQLGDALSYAAPFAAATGVEVEQAAAAIGVMSDAGIQASRAGTGLIGIFRQTASVTPKAAGILEKYGLTAEDVSIQTHGLETVLERLAPVAASSADAIEFFGSEAGAAAQVVLNGRGRVDELTTSLQSAEGAADRAALIIGSGLTGSMRGFNSMASESILQIGESGLTGAFEAATDRATGLLAVYNGMLDEFAQANDLTGEQVASIQSMANAIDAAATSALALATVYAGSLAGSTLAAASASAKKAIESQKAAAAEAQAATAAVRRTAAEKQTALALLNTAKLEAQATKGTAAHTFALQQLSVARTRAATAAGAHTAAMNTATAATARASVAARGLSGAITALGGPIGLLIGGAGLLYLFREELGAVQAKAGLTEEQIEDLKDEMAAMSNAEIGTTLSEMGAELDAMTLKAAAAREELAKLRNENRGSGVLGFEGGSVGEEIRGMQAVADVQARIAELNDRIAVARSEAGERIQQNAKVFTDSLNDSEDDASELREELARLEDRLDEVGAAEKRYADQLKTLDEALAKGEISQERYNELKAIAVERLNKAREAANDNTESTTTNTTAVDAAARAAEEYANELDALRRSLDPAYARQQDFAQATDLLDQALVTGKVTLTEYLALWDTAAERMIDAEDSTRDLSDTTTDEVDSMSREWERFGNSVDDTFKDAFKGAFDSFDDFADQLKGAFENLLAELAYAAVKNEIKIQLGMGTSGPMSGGIGDIANIFSGGSGGGLSSISNLFGGGSTAASAGGLYSTAATGAAQGGLYGNVATGGVAGSGSLMSGLAANAGPIAAMYAAAEMGNNLLQSSGAYDALGIETGGRSSEFLGQFMPIGGTIIGSGLDALGIGGQPTEFSGRFGTNASSAGFEHQGNEGNEGQFYRQSAFGTVGFMDQGTERLQRAGTGSKEWADNLAASTAQMDNLVASLARSEPELQSMTSAVQGLETSSGSAADIIEFALQERPRAAINAMSGDFGAFVQSLQGDIEQVVGQAQSASAAYDLLSNNSERLGIQFNVTGGYAYEAALSVAEFAGGVQNLEALQSSYYQNFFTDAERAANVTDDLTASLNSMGLQMPETRDGFRDLVSAQDLSTESGRQTYAQLLQLSSAFADVTPATEAATQAVEDNTDAQREREGLERELLRLQGDTAALRQLELDELDPANRALQNRIWALEDAEEADDRAAEASERRRREMERQAAAMDQARSQLAGFTTNINDWINGLQSTDAGLGTPTEQLSSASGAFDEQYQAALSGDRSALSSITQYADQFINAQKAFSASGRETTATIDRVTDMLADLPDQLTPEEFLAQEFDSSLQTQTTELLADWDSGFNSLLTGIASDFDQIDTSLDGLLSADELNAALTGKATDAEIRALIAGVDKNGDGLISRMELNTATIGELRSGITSTLSDSFGALDSNVDGLLTLDELKQGLGGIATDETLQAIMDSMDLNSDGVISKLESVVIAEMPNDSVLTSVLRNQMQTLGSKTLTAQQVRSALSPVATGKEIDALISRVDANGDGIISEQELANSHLDGLSQGIAGALDPLFNSIDLDASGLIDYDEFGKQFAGMATDEELRSIFNAIDANGDGTISRLEAVNASTKDIANPNTEGMKVSIGRHHNPSGLQDMAYNWMTYWANKGAPGFAGTGGGQLEYEPVGGGTSGGGGSSGSSSSGGSGSATEGLSINERARLYYQRYPDLQAYYQENADAFHKREGGRTAIDFAKWHWLDGPGQTDGADRYFADGGAFTNGIVSEPTAFNMGVMGEAGPEAIMPLERGPSGALGVRMWSAPTMLGGNDVRDVLTDMRQELQALRRENSDLQSRIADNTGGTAGAVMQGNQQAERQRDTQIKEQRRQTRAQRIKERD